jgi:RNA polymerase sigma factor (sigma-70 family)
MSEVGVRSRLARLLMTHRAGLYGFIFACVRNHEDAQGIFQQVAAAVNEARGQLPDDHAFVPWARDIARAKILAYPRSNPRAQPMDSALLQSLAEAADRVEALRPAADYQDALLSCLEKLPVKGRLLLAMRHDDAVRSVDELAARLGRSVQTAYALLKQVKVLLRECVERRVTAKFDHGITRAK